MTTPSGRHRLQLIATLGPSSLKLASQLLQAGATAFRLNASHLEPSELRHMLDLASHDAPSLPVIVDLQGAKMRLGAFDPRPVSVGELVQFALSPHHEQLPIPHPELFNTVQREDTLSCDDARIQLRVTRIEPNCFEAQSLSCGILRARKGINVLGHPVRMTSLSAKDRAQVELCAGFHNVHFAFSFMNDGQEVSWLKQLCPDRRVIGKIERQEAIENLDSIAAASDEVWICRGDMGAQLGIAPMAKWVSQVDPRRLAKPVIMAGQVLEHLTQHAEPTRSESCHLNDIVVRGYAGIVLSDETAIGADPVNAVRTARSLLSSFYE